MVGSVGGLAHVPTSHSSELEKALCSKPALQASAPQLSASFLLIYSPWHPHVSFP